MPIIPDYEPYRGGEHRPSVASPRSAGLVAEANAQLGQTVGKVAQDLGELASRERRANDLGEEARIGSRMVEADELHRQYREGNRDESTWVADADSRIAAVGEELGKLRLSPEARERAQAGYEQWADAFRSQTSAASRANAVTRGRNESTGMRLRMEKGGNFDGSRLQVRREVDAGLRTEEDARAEEEQVELRRSQWQREREDEDERARIAEDPAAWLGARDPSQVPQGVDPVRYRGYQEYAVKALEIVTAETSALIRDGIATGKVTSEGEVRELASSLRPGAVDLLVRELAEQAEGKRAEQRRSPQFREGVIGTATALMSEYRPDFDNFDERYVAIELEIGKLEDGPERRHLGEQLAKLREGKLREVQTAQELAERTLGDLYQQGLFGRIDGTGRGRGVTRTAIDSELLRDRAKLEKRGFTPEQAEEIAGAYNPVPVFRRLQGGVTAKDANAPFDSAALDAVRDRQEHFEWVDPREKEKGDAERLQARIRLGRARTEIMEFARLHPQAKPEEFEAAVRKVAKGETLRQQAVEMVGEIPKVLKESYHISAVDETPPRRRVVAGAEDEGSGEESSRPERGVETRSDQEAREGAMQ